MVYNQRNSRQMQKIRLANVLIAPIILFTFVSGIAQTATPASPVEIIFTVAMPRPHTHMLEVDIEIKRRADTAAPGEELLVMPVWTPGSYLIREYQRHLQDF